MSDPSCSSPDAPEDRIGHTCDRRDSPEFGATRHSRPTALVSGHRDKALSSPVTTAADKTPSTTTVPGVYCINAARFPTGEEPVEVIGDVYSTPRDPRSTGVERSAHFILRFQNGMRASCVTSFAAHRSHSFGLVGTTGWAEMNPAYAYNGLRLRIDTMVDGLGVIEEPQTEPANQFALEIDHMSRCIQRNRDVDLLTRGEEGMQDQRIIEAIYNGSYAW